MANHDVILVNLHVNLLWVQLKDGNSGVYVCVKFEIFQKITAIAWNYLKFFS